MGILRFHDLGSLGRVINREAIAMACVYISRGPDGDYLEERSRAGTFHKKFPGGGIGNASR